MPDRPQAVLRLEPHQIPALHAAFDKAAQDVNAALAQDPRIMSPWLADPTSETVRTAHNTHADSTVAHLTAYRDELVRTARTLTELDAAYRRTDGDNVRLWGRTT